MRILDWAPNHDERSLNYKARAVMPLQVAVRPKMWRQGTVLDQGSEGACVGFGWTAELLAEPMRPIRQPSAAEGNEFALNVYNEAKKIDEWPGEDYPGTSVLAGAKIIQSKGMISGYRWCFGITDLRDAVLTQGPVVIGVPWYEEMYETRPSGLVKVGGKKVGGHCITVTGYHPYMRIDGKVREIYRWRNSWGADYGINGNGYIEAHVLAQLLDEGGEACVPEGRGVVRI